MAYNDLEMVHFEHFKKHIPGIKKCCTKTINHLLSLGLLQVSTAFEQALASVGRHDMVSEDWGDLRRRGVYSDAKFRTVEPPRRGTALARVGGLVNKTGALRVQVYERVQNKFYYFVIPYSAYKNIKGQSIKIPFEGNGDPRRKNNCDINWWKYEVKTWAELASK